MSQPTAIEWTDFTWNPTRGCTRVSPGCLNCYAERIAARFNHDDGPFAGFAQRTKAGPRWTGRVEIHEPSLLAPLRKRSWRGKRVFVNSMSDLFHEALPYEAIDKVFAVMALCPDITFQVLTKRARRMREYMRSSWEPRLLDHMRAFAPLPPGEGVLFKTINGALPNVHLGISAEDQSALDDRAPRLLATPAAVRFVSLEPLLGPIDATPYIFCVERQVGRESVDYSVPCPNVRLDWVITGGESGPNARPAHPDWFRALRDQCAAANVPFFFKQWGEWAPTLHDWTGRGAEHRIFPDTGQVLTAAEFDIGPWSDEDAEEIARVGKRNAGNLLDGVQHLAFPTINNRLP